jgi:ERCC4-type nuclease
MIMEELSVDQQKAENLLKEFGSVRKVLEQHKPGH